jgi:hypothetical protein
MQYGSQDIRIMIKSDTQINLGGGYSEHEKEKYRME